METPFEKFVSVFLKITGLNFLLNAIAVGNDRGYIGYVAQVSTGLSVWFISFLGIVYRTASEGMDYASVIGILFVITLVTMFVSYKMNQWMSDWVKATDEM